MAPPVNAGSPVLAPPERNNFFFGKLMDVEQWQKDQRHFDLKRSLVNRLVLGSGVVCGLGLEAAEEGRQRLLPGMALDGWGREIVVAAPVPFDPHQLTGDDGEPVGDPLTSGVVVVCLAYAERRLDAMPVLVPDCDHPGGCAAGTIREEHRVLVRPATADPLPPPECGFGQVPWSDPKERYLRLLERITKAGVASPADPCVELGRVDLADGSVDLSGRPLVYGNALLLELLMCLADQALGQP